jgi:hypothetical protein
MINLNETIQNINQNISQTISELSKNYLINGSFRVAQKATSAAITASTAVPTSSLGYPVFDCWYAYSVGGNPTLAQVNSSGGSTPFYLQMTGAASVSSFGVGQRIEAINSANLALKTVTLSFECSNSLLTSLTVAAYRPATTANTFGTVGTPSRTLIDTTSININSTLTKYDWTFTCPQEVDKGLEIVFTSGAQVSGTFVLSNVKLEEGAVPTPFTVNSFAEELIKCKRYSEILVGDELNFNGYAKVSSFATFSYRFPVTKFSIPTFVDIGSNYVVQFQNSVVSISSFGVAQMSDKSTIIDVGCAAVLTPGDGVIIRAGSSTTSKLAFLSYIP